MRIPSSTWASRAVRLAIGVALVGVAIALRSPVEPILGGRNVFVVLEPAIAIAAWYGGLLSGTSATATSVLASAFLYLQPTGSLVVADQGDQLALILFSLNGVVLSALSSGLRRAFERATQARGRAEEAVVRSERLQRFALALNRPMAPATLAKTAVIQAVELLGGIGGLVATGRAADTELHVLATHGYTGGTKTGDSVPNDTANPLGDVLRKSEPLSFHGRAERMARYPSLAERFTIEGDSMVIPMLYEGAATGAIYLNFDGASGYGEADRDYLRSIGVQCGSALARAQLIERTADLAATQQARAAELETVLEAIGDGLLVGDAHGQVILKNRAAARLLGPVPALLSDLPARVADAPGERVAADRYLAHSPKRPQDWLEITAFPVTKTSATSDVVLIRDVTRAIEADLQRDAFLGVLSHELRTPITTILAGVNLLLQSEVRGEDLNRELLRDIDAESTRLHRIVDDLLVLTRSERGALDVSGEPVLVHRLVQQVAERERATSPDVDIRLQNDDDLAPVEAEPTYVQQIVRNLLSNAIKYGRAPGQPIEVVVSGADGTVETRVLDRGVGIGPGEAERLFTLFYRNPKVIGSAPGAGIGLYVCRLLTEAMGGRTWAKPRSGGGSEFGFSLPTMSDGGRLDDAREVASPAGIPEALLPKAR